MPSLVHNGDHNDSENDFLFCYTAQKRAVKNGKQRSQWRETPEKLGDSPIPEFPSNWAPTKDKKGNFTLSEKNPFNLANFNRRRAAGEKISQALKKWGLDTPGAKGDRIRRLGQRVEKCQEIPGKRRQGEGFNPIPRPCNHAQGHRTQSIGAVRRRTFRSCNS